MVIHEKTFLVGFGRLPEGLLIDDPDRRDIRCFFFSEFDHSVPFLRSFPFCPCF
jgi:hypothetical protein